MRKLFNRRPSAGLVVGFIALCVALGGGAYAATSKKIEYKGLSKDARLKVLPVSATNAGTKCDPKTTEFTKCTSVDLSVSSAFPRRVMLIFNGTFDGGAAAATGDCDLELDGKSLTGTLIHVDARAHTKADTGDGYGINIVTTPQGGKHTFSANCKETSGDLKVQSFQLSAATTR